MKKVLAATLICAVSSFATWDLFPVQPAGKGEAKLGFEYGMPAEKFSYMGLNIGARYSIIEGLEAAITLEGPGYFLSQSYDGESIDDASGLSQPVIGVRYWLPMGLGIFADVLLPFGSKDIVGEEPDLGLSAGVQYSTKFSEQLSLGSELSFNKIFSDPGSGADLGVAVELDFSLGQITPWVSVDFVKGILAPEDIDMGPLGKIEQDPAPAGIGVSAGVIYDISEALYVDASVWLGVAGDRYDVGSMPIIINADVGFKF